MHVHLASAAAELGVKTRTELHKSAAIGQKGGCVCAKLCPGQSAQPKVERAPMDKDKLQESNLGSKDCAH